MNDEPRSSFRLQKLTELARGGDLIQKPLVELGHHLESFPSPSSFHHDLDDPCGQDAHADHDDDRCQHFHCHPSLKWGVNIRSIQPVKRNFSAEVN